MIANEKVVKAKSLSANLNLARLPLEDVANANGIYSP